MITDTTMHLLRDSLATCGVPLPPEAEAAAEVLSVLRSEAQRDVVDEALTAANDTPLTAKNARKRVQDLAVALTAKDRAAEAARYLERPVLERFRVAIANSGDSLIEALRPYFDHAAQVLHTYGPTLDPMRPITARDGADAVGDDVAIKDAQKRLHAVNAAYVRVAEIVKGYAVADVSWYLESADDDEALRLAGVMWKRGAHHLVHAGYRLRLNTLAEAEQVVANAARGTREDQDRQARQRVADNRFPLRDAAYAQVLGR